MNPRAARALATVFFLLFLVFVTWPGMVPFNRIYPLVLGLPFSMFWISLWVFLSFLVLLAVDQAEEKGRDRGDRPTRAPQGEPGPTAGQRRE